MQIWLKEKKNMSGYGPSEMSPEHWIRDLSDIEGYFIVLRINGNHPGRHST